MERHGAIRLGTAAELATMRRLFAVMGMEPVGYYDLSVAGVPVHSTAFRPVADAALAHNPFRVFTSLLRLELIADETLRAQAAAILERRQIFTEGALRLIERFEAAGGLDAQQADDFVAEALQTFRWHAEATVDSATYEKLQRAHRLPMWCALKGRTSTTSRRARSILMPRRRPCPALASPPKS